MGGLDGLLQAAGVLSRLLELVLGAAEALATTEGLTPEQFAAKRAALDSRDVALTDKAKAELAALLKGPQA